MSYVVSYISNKETILKILVSLKPQLQWSNGTISQFVPETLQLLRSQNTIKFPDLSREERSGLNETAKYYEHNQSKLDEPNRDFGLVVAKKDDTIIGTIWLHFHDDYATFIGIRATISYLLARRVDNTLKPLSSLLIPFIIEEARKHEVKRLYSDPLFNMQYLLTKYYKFRATSVSYNVKNMYGWGNDFNCRLSEKDIEIKKTYSEQIGERWNNSMVDVSATFYTLDL
ncbi:Hypothetical protein HVR_LOCUS32 [uncultured virus]|nr:Hypothetical protein HVR_LOCUS32 [uncultured virus]